LKEYVLITYLTPLAPLSTTNFSKVFPPFVSYSKAGLHLTATLILDIFLEAPYLGSSAMFYIFSFYIDLRYSSATFLFELLSKIYY
tara:strand:+ start:6054 stop:6311 length:258 start_codon:yes stop_codon:yes gene_type:complete